ncbi:FRG domain-containing protein [Clostridium sp. KNHs205]|uniref:FRG domain-containing protein n=1 Tax=Clostridium sp. KNHs205 TaxID=1449050 RepID=UPI00051C7577|nr:FRG domain-containing protein [Clostridium sp. KNHs205]
MVLDDLYKIVSVIMNNTNDVDEILQKPEIRDFKSIEKLEKTDQEIDEFIKKNENEEEKQKILFNVFQKIKIEQSIEIIQGDVEAEIIDNDKKMVYSLFSKILEPDEVEIQDNILQIKYDFSEESMIKSRISDIKKWGDDNVVETLSKKLGVPLDNIIFIDSVGAYIEFISTFEENNYVSRGQKDCTYKLEPSLHRLYKDGYIGHLSQYESTFKQRVLYYDDKTEKKNNEELRAYGQHFGLPTNYLDFTEAHLISLLFAVEEYDYIDNHSIVYFVDALSHNKSTIKSERKLVDFSDNELKMALQREYSDKSYFVRVGNCNERIHFQKGCFLKVEASDSLDAMLSNYTKIAVIDKNCKEDILKELFKLGITFENIYPDKDNMVKTIRFIKEHM